MNDTLDKLRYVECWADPYGNNWQVMDGSNVLVLRSTFANEPDKDAMLIMRMHKGVPHYIQAAYNVIDGKMNYDAQHNVQIEFGVLNYMMLRYRIKRLLPDALYKALYRMFSTIVPIKETHED
jgi:hypothetical protein